MITVWRLFLFSWKNLFRNAWIGLATIFVFTMALVSVNVLLGVDALLGRVITVLEDKVDVTVTFVQSTPDGVVTQAKFYLTSLPQVANVQLITPDQALAAFRTRHAQEPKVLAALDELKTNPLGAQLIIKAKNPDDYPFLLQAIQNPQYSSYIQSRTYDDHQDAINRVREIGKNARLVGAILVALFAFFGMLTAFNAIRVAIYTQREEIAIMRLVGASSWFIRGPFILEGIWLASISIILSLVIVFTSIYWLEPAIRPVFDGANPGLFDFFIQQWPLILFAEAAIMFSLVGLVSWAAVGRYIKR